MIFEVHYCTHYKTIKTNNERKTDLNIDHIIDNIVLTRDMKSNPANELLFYL